MIFQFLHSFEGLWSIAQFNYEGNAARKIAGIDVSYQGIQYIAALITFEEKEVVGIKIKSGISHELYRPSLFFLKEGPIISELVYGEPINFLFVNGHGISSLFLRPGNSGGHDPRHHDNRVCPSIY